MATLRHVGRAGEGGSGRFGCPFCASFDVDRMYVATLDADACECRTCGVRWDEARRTGLQLEHADRASVLAPRHR